MPALDLVVFSVGLLVALPVCRTPGAAVDPSAGHVVSFYLSHDKNVELISLI